jgi:phage/plasmid-associated DNA primase
MIFIATNDQVLFDAGDPAFTDRLVHIVFKRTRDIDRLLNAKLEREQAGIFNWILEGVLAYLDDDMIEPESIRAARERSLTVVSSPLQYIAEKLETGKLREVGDGFPKAKCCKVRELYERYELWCDLEGIKPTRQHEFGRIVGGRYPIERVTDGKRYIGIAPGV